MEFENSEQAGMAYQIARRKPIPSNKAFDLIFTCKFLAVESRKKFGTSCVQSMSTFTQSQISSASFKQINVKFIIHDVDSTGCAVTAISEDVQCFQLNTNLFLSNLSPLVSPKVCYSI